MTTQKQLIIVTTLIALALPFLAACHFTTTSERCGNDFCGEGETCSSCPSDCGQCTACGDGTCNGGETCSSCPRDCGDCPGCGDGTCSAGETCSTCPADCGACVICGDDTCSAGETCSTCPADCGACPTVASLAFVWKILGAKPNGPVCTSVGGSRVQLWIDENGDGVADTPYDFNCSAGSGQTPSDFVEGQGITYAFALLAASGSVITQSASWYTETLEAGVNDLGSVDFTVDTDHDASVGFAWYIHYVLADDALCGTMSAQTVQLWLDDNGDSLADRSFDADCGDGYGSTGFVFDSGTTIRFAFALLDASGTVLAQSAAWDTRVLVTGDNDLGTVNFIVGDYGPLGVGLEWANAMASPSYGGCTFPSPTVDIMGYLLCWGGLVAGECPSGNLYDVVDIDTAPVDCAEHLDWDIIDYGTYTLVLDGEDTAGTTIWGSECQSLLVDSVELDSNEFTCQVLMTATP